MTLKNILGIPTYDTYRVSGRRYTLHSCIWAAGRHCVTLSYNEWCPIAKHTIWAPGPYYEIGQRKVTISTK